MNKLSRYRWVIAIIAVALGALGVWRFLPFRATEPTSSPLSAAAPESAPSPVSTGTAELQPLDVPPSWENLLTNIDPRFRPTGNTLSEGEALSLVHCSICHLRPAAEVLPESAWLELFPHLYPPIKGSTAKLALPAPAFRGYRIPAVDHAKIMFYYLTQSPKSSLPQLNRPPLGSQVAPFKIKHAKVANPFHPEAFVLAKIIDGGKQIVLGHGSDELLVVINPRDGTSHQVTISGLATGFLERKDGYYLTLIGPNPYPNNEALGKVVRIPLGSLNKGPIPRETVILSELRRPVHTTIADLDGDHVDDFLVEEFGFSDGGLNWYQRDADGTLKKNVLLEQSGALSAHVKDFNQDGTPDVLALIAQNVEAIFLFSGKGAGKFEQETIEQKHPGFGSNQVIVGDMNGDKFDDLVLVGGDNMDLPSRPLKNYHGIYIFLNDGRNKFQESFFYALDGAIQAVARDFDRDGDLDLAATAMFPDFSRRPLETFVYLENKGGKGTLDFEPRRLPGTEKGRWSVIDAGDIDGDGDDDLIIGAVNIQPLEKEWTDAFGEAERFSYMVYENTTRRSQKQR